MTHPSTDRPDTHRPVEYDDVDPICIRDPVAEALAVLAPGEPFTISYADVVTAAGHSCPTTAGAFRTTQLGLDALYPDTLPVRSDVQVTAGGPKDDPTYGVTSRLVSYITGAAEADGFGGLAGGCGDRRHLLHFGDADHGDPRFTFQRIDTGAAVAVQYHVGDVPPAGDAVRSLPALVEGTATDAEREAFAEAWHGRVHEILTDDELFTVESVE